MIDVVKKILSKVTKDHRGFFHETYNRRYYAELGIDLEFVQDNHSLSRNLNTIRGLHFQAPPHAQAKLIRCARGAIYDVVVDIRRGSPSYGQWEGYELTEEAGDQLFVPVGFAHGFLTLMPDTEIVYKCSDFYAPKFEGAVRWDTCQIDWPLSGEPILSDKDQEASPLDDFDSPFFYGENS